MSEKRQVKPEPPAKVTDIWDTTEEAKSMRHSPDTQYVWVRAERWYSNGTLEVNWNPGEVRRVPKWKLERLEQDLPGNWMEVKNG